MKYAHPVVAAAVASLGFKIDLKGSEEFIAGIILGFVHHDDLTEIQKCLDNGERVESEIEQIVSDFELKDTEHIIKGIEETISLINEFPEDLQDCKDIQGDLDKIADWAKSINLLSIPGNVVKHLLGITKDVQKIQDDWKYENYEDAGETVTDILFKVLGGPKEEDLPTNPDFLY